jgi:hypothetical protein
MSKYFVSFGAQYQGTIGIYNAEVNYGKVSSQKNIDEIQDVLKQEYKKQTNKKCDITILNIIKLPI